MFVKLWNYCAVCHGQCLLPSETDLDFEKGGGTARSVLIVDVGLAGIYIYSHSV